ncbi:SDR family oxidoreductase [Mycetocola tolaasinivorans]|uniref:SDR family oxidoreductase n=1 Tax=Mycetocola tolaasinivorans TaxID=76635 RepID=A0A3L7A5U0_9MICO|nr:SDR family oxidoreductase [Mycetocola tolaasinivorans]RLP75679.1 SDR family oxidoreductase [Mycetocola tolaasinivorans]
MSAIAIIGGHGKVALHLARVLVNRGHQVTGFVRNPDHITDVEETGASARVADVETLVIWQLADLLQGFDAIVWSAGAGGGNPERTFAVDRDAAIRTIDAAVRTGLRRFVMVSYQGAGPDHGIDPEDSFYAYAEAKAAADEYLRRQDLDWTILAPGGLTDEPSTGEISITAERGRVSRENVALVAADVLHAPETAGLTLPFTDGDVAIAEALRAAIGGEEPPVTAPTPVS